MLFRSNDTATTEIYTCLDTLSLHDALPIYDAHFFDLSFPLGDRPYLVPLAAHTLSPFGPQPGGRPVGGGENSKDLWPERTPLTVDTDTISSRVVAVPVEEARYYSLAPVKGGLVWLRYPVAGPHLLDAQEIGRAHV